MKTNRNVIACARRSVYCQRSVARLLWFPLTTTCLIKRLCYRRDVYVQDCLEMPVLKSKKQKADCLITLPSSTVHYVSISEDSTGHDCIEKVIIWGDIIASTVAFYIYCCWKIAIIVINSIYTDLFGTWSSRNGLFWSQICRSSWNVSVAE